MNRANPIAKRRRTLRRSGLGAETNRVAPHDSPAHDWYRFVLSFPPHLVREYLDRFAVGPRHRVLDPFCGTGTTLVECKKAGVPALGIEAHPMVAFASRVKVDWSPEPKALRAHAEQVSEAALAEMEREGIDDDGDLPLFGRGRAVKGPLRRLPEEAARLLLRGSISPLPLHKTLVLLDHLERQRDDRFYAHERLALAKALVTSIGNLHFGPEVGVGPAKQDAPVVGAWLGAVGRMAEDLLSLREAGGAASEVFCADARCPSSVLKKGGVDAVITSPPYPNEKDYTRTTRLESVLLGFLRTKVDLRALKQGLMRSNTRNVFKGDADDAHVSENGEIQRLADRIEARRIALGKTSGFERNYAKVTRQYFGGMSRHLAALRDALRPGARLAYVVGDQASYLRVMIRTGEILASIAQSLGYQVLGIDLFRTRLATATRAQLREEVVLLQWPGCA